MSGNTGFGGPSMGGMGNFMQQPQNNTFGASNQQQNQPFGYSMNQNISGGMGQNFGQPNNQDQNPLTSYSGFMSSGQQPNQNQNQNFGFGANTQGGGNSLFD